MKTRKKLKLTSWFDTEVDGPPKRVGIYEGSAIGIPGTEEGTVQHGYYFWNGEKWKGWGQSPDDIRPSFPFQARFWRGVIPDKDYPYDQVKVYQPNHLTGILKLVGTAAGQVNVHRLEISEVHLRIQFTWEPAHRDAEKYQSTLVNQGTEFIGKAKARIQSFTATSDTHIRVVVSADRHDTNADSFPIALSLRSHSMQWQQFHGLVQKPSA